MIVVTENNFVIGWGIDIYRCDVDGEKNIIKVVVDESEWGYWYIGTVDRDLYVIYTDTFPPDTTKQWNFYVLPDGTYEYVEVESGGPKEL